MAQTPSTEDLYEGDGVRTVFPLTFPYLSQDEVFVAVDDVNTPYVWVGGSTASVQLAVAPVLGAEVKVYRNTKAFVPLHVFAGGVPFLPRYIDENNRQLLYVSQEAINSTAGTAAEALVVAEEAKVIAEEANAKVDAAIIDSAALLRTQLASAIGATLVTTSTGSTVEQRLIELANAIDSSGVGIKPKQFGAVGDGVADDTIPVMDAYNAALLLGVRIIDMEGGNFRVSHLDWDAGGGLLIKGGGSITGMTSGTYESVLTVRNAVDINFVGRTRISASYNTGYACAAAFYDDSGAGFAKNDFRNVGFHGAKVGLRIGIDAHPDALLSETTVFGGYFYGCPTCVELIGSQLVYSFMGTQLVSGVEGVPTGQVAEWATLPRTAVRSFGANFSLIGGSAHITDVDNGLLFDLRPISSPNPAIGNRFGTGTILGTNIETASQLARLWNPAGLPDLKAAGGFQMTGVTGYMSNDAYEAVVAYDDFPGYIDIRGNPGFAAGVTRTKLNVNAGLSTCRIYLDESSFGQGFLSGFAGCSGGVLFFGEQKIMELRNLGTLAIAASATTALRFSEKPTTVPGNGRFAALYNSTTGAFTVPAGGLKSVRIHVNLDLGFPRPDSLINVVVNGTSFRSYAGTAGSRYFNAVLEVGDLVAGDTVVLNFVAQGATSAFSFVASSNDKAVFYGRR